LRTASRRRRSRCPNVASWPAARVPRIWVTAVVGLALLLRAPIFAGQAQAVICPGQLDYDFLNNYWQPTDDLVAGFRAPIVLRTDGATCTTSPSFTSSWVGVVGQTNPGISQIGWVNFGGLYCRFYEWNNNHGTDTGIVTYGSCADPSATEIWYKVQQWYNSSTGLYYWGVYDCGSGWGACAAKAGGPRTNYIGAVVGIVTAESNFGGASCTNVQMGSSGFRVRFGEPASPIEGQRTYNGLWDVRPLAFVDDAQCASYASNDHNDSNMKTYDTRN
jgi:hypothetical protein